MLITRSLVIVSFWLTGYWISVMFDWSQALFQIEASFVASVKFSFVKLGIWLNCQFLMVLMLSANNNWPSCTSAFL